MVSCKLARLGGIVWPPTDTSFDFVTWLELRVPFGQGFTQMEDTVEPRYVELGYLELPAISNRIGFPLDLPLFFESFTMGYLELSYLEHPAISNCFSLP